MQCQEFKDNIFAYCEGSLPSGQQAKFTLHLEKCNSCRQHHKFTLLETELLAEANEIPSPSSSFTSQVMQGLETATLPESTAPEPLGSSQRGFHPRPRFGLATAAAVVLALVIMSPQYLNDKQVPQVAINDSPALQREIAPAYLGAPEPSIASDTSEDRAKSESDQPGVPKASTASEPNIAPLAAAEEQIIAGSPPESDSVFSTTPAGAKNLSATAQALVSGAVSDITLPDDAAYAPENIPAQFKLVAVDAHGANQTVYSYVDAFSEESLQLELVVSDSSISGDGSGSIATNLKASRLSSDFNFTDIKVTVYISGNLTAAELESLAKTITIAPISTVR